MQMQLINQLDISSNHHSVTHLVYQSRFGAVLDERQENLDWTHRGGSSFVRVEALFDVVFPS